MKLALESSHCAQVSELESVAPRSGCTRVPCLLSPMLTCGVLERPEVTERLVAVDVLGVDRAGFEESPVALNAAELC